MAVVRFSASEKARGQRAFETAGLLGKKPSTMGRRVEGVHDWDRGGGRLNWEASMWEASRWKGNWQAASCRRLILLPPAGRLPEAASHVQATSHPMGLRTMAPSHFAVLLARKTMGASNRHSPPPATIKS